MVGFVVAFCMKEIIDVFYESVYVTTLERFAESLKVITIEILFALVGKPHTVIIVSLNLNQSKSHKDVLLLIDRFFC